MFDEVLWTLDLHDCLLKCNDNYNISLAVIKLRDFVIDSRLLK